MEITGKVDGKEVVFERVERDLWAITVPYDLDGMYVVEVTAVNDRGVTAYRTKMLLIVDPDTLRIELLPYDYYVEIISEDYIVDIIYPNYEGRGCCHAMF